METTAQNLFSVLRAAIYDISLKDFEGLTSATRISELGLDSIAMLEVIGVLEENLSIRIADEEVASLEA
jgi:acyl carrier protein